MVAKLYYILFNWRRQETRKVAFVPSYRSKFYIYLAAFNGIMIALEILLLVIWEAVAIPEPERLDTLTGDNEQTKVCRGFSDGAHYTFIALQCAYVAIMILAGLVAALPAYFVPVFWLEARNLAIAIVVCTLTTVGTVIPTFILQDVPEAWIALLGFGIFISLSLTLCIVFLPKLYYVIFSKANRQSISFFSHPELPEVDSTDAMTPRRRKSTLGRRHRSINNDIFAPAPSTAIDDGLDDL